MASYTPIYIKDELGNIDIVTIEHLARKYGGNVWFPCKELGKQDHSMKTVDGVNNQLLAKTAHKESAGKNADVKPGISPVGSRQNKIPTPKGK